MGVSPRFGRLTWIFPATNHDVMSDRSCRVTDNFNCKYQNISAYTQVSKDKGIAVDCLRLFDTLCSLSSAQHLNPGSDGCATIWRTLPHLSRVPPRAKVWTKFGLLPVDLTPVTRIGYPLSPLLSSLTQTSSIFTSRNYRQVSIRNTVT